MTTAEVDVLAHRVTTVEAAVNEIKDAVATIASAVQAIAALEAHHSETRNGLERAFNAIANVEKEVKEFDKRLRDIEVAMPGLKEVRTWVICGVLATVAIVGGAMAAMVVR